MSWQHALLVLSVLASSGRVLGKPQPDSSEQKEKKDLAPAETRVGVLPYEPLEAYGAGPILNGPYEAAYGVPHAYPLHRPLGYIDDRNAGYLRSGINEGALALGNRGSNYYRGGNDGQFTDGLYHEGGNLQDGGFQGLEAYKDNKQHLADDYNSKAFYNGVQGARKDIGNGQIFDKSQGFSQNAYNTLGNNELAGHNKGHHKTGFKKSYHKDESGQDESFYDVDHDEGNREIGKKYGDQIGTNFATSLNGGHKLNEFEAQQLGRNGYEGNGKLIALNNGLKDYYGRNGLYNSGNKYGSLGTGQAANFGKYGSQQGFLNGYNNGRNIDDYYGSRFGNGLYGGYGR